MAGDSGVANACAASTRAPSCSCSRIAAVKKPAADRRSYEYLTVGGDGEGAGGMRVLLVSDSDAVFAAACLNMQAGYFDDPPDVPGFAHWLEHAVHLGSGRYPDDKDYKYYLSQHGGTSNASTGTVHTSYHFTVAADHLPGALDRMARFFTDPLLNPDSILKEAENVDAEFSRNRNSDARKLLQLRRSTAGGVLGKFSTGNAATLRDGPAASGADVPAALAAFWRRRYLAGALCGVVVGPQGLDELRNLVEGSFAGVRARDLEGEEGAAAAELSGGGGGGGRYCFDDMCGLGRLGRLFRVASQRELRELQVVWYLPYGMTQDIRSKPWRWASHVLGHEGRGSLAALLRGAGLAQELSTGSFDEVRLGRGFMFWGVTITLSEAGLGRVDDVMRLLFAAVQAMCSLREDQRRQVWCEVAETTGLRWQHQDRTAPLDLARETAHRLHYFGPEDVLSGNFLMDEYDASSLERFLAHLTPDACNVYLSDCSFAGETTLVEKWYGAQYCEEPLRSELYDVDTAAVAAAVSVHAGPAAAVDPAGSPEDSCSQLLARLRLPSAPSWALPVDVRLVQEDVTPAAGAAAAAAAAPHLVLDSGAVRLWHLLDASFGVPKTHMFAHLITRAVYRSPAAWVTARMACRLMDELLQPDVYDAQLVGTHYSLSCSETGLQLSFSGFSGVLARLVEVVAAALQKVTLAQVEARYGLVHGKLLRSLRMWRHNNPAQHAEYATEHMLQQPSWHADDSIAVLEKAAPPPAAAAAEDPAEGEGVEAEAGPRAVWELLRGLGRGMALEVLVYGNSTEEQARELCATLERHLRPTGLGPDGWPATRILQLAVAAGPAGAAVASGDAAAATPDAALSSDESAATTANGSSGTVGASIAAAPVLLRYVPANPNPSNSNSAVFFLCQVGEEDPRDARPSVLLSLLAKVASKPAFHELRTKQRLGYVVSLARHRLGGVMGLSVRVQSPDKKPGMLRECVREWLSGFGSELRDLAPERLASFKASLEEKYLEPPRSLAEAASEVWRPIRYRSYDFGSKARKAETLQELGLEDLVGFYEQHARPVASATTRVVCCEVWGGAGGDREAGEDTAPGWRRLGDEDVPGLHEQLPHFCHSDTLGVLRTL